MALVSPSTMIHYYHLSYNIHCLDRSCRRLHTPSLPKRQKLQTSNVVENQETGKPGWTSCLLLRESSLTLNIRPPLLVEPVLLLYKSTLELRRSYTCSSPFHDSVWNRRILCSFLLKSPMIGRAYRRFTIPCCTHIIVFFYGVFDDCRGQMFSHHRSH